MTQTMAEVMTFRLPLVDKQHTVWKVSTVGDPLVKTAQISPESHLTSRVLQPDGLSDVIFMFKQLVMCVRGLSRCTLTANALKHTVYFILATGGCVNTAEEAFTTVQTLHHWAEGL